MRNHPRDLVKHCLQKTSLAMGVGLSAINIFRHNVFSVKSFANNASERYIIDFGGDEKMANCTCQELALSYHSCKHFFAVFRKYIPWQWDALSPTYINSPFLTLDNLDDTAENNNKSQAKTKLNSLQETQLKMNSLQKPQMKIGLINVLMNLYILMKKVAFTEISSRK